MLAERFYRVADWKGQLDEFRYGDHYSIQPTEEGEGTSWVHSHGLMQFDMPEVEVRVVPPELVERAFNFVDLTTQCMFAGERFGDGHTIGADGDPEVWAVCEYVEVEEEEATTRATAQSSASRTITGKPVRGKRAWCDIWRQWDDDNGVEFLTHWHLERGGRGGAGARSVSVVEAGRVPGRECDGPGDGGGYAGAALVGREPRGDRVRASLRSQPAVCLPSRAAGAGGPFGGRGGSGRVVRRAHVPERAGAGELRQQFRDLAGGSRGSRVRGRCGGRWPSIIGVGLPSSDTI